MANGDKKLLRELRPGDRVLAMNAYKQIAEDEVIMMLDSQPKRPGFFKKNIFNDFNHKDQFLPANQIKTHDIVYIHSQGQLKPVTVRNVSEEYRVGYFTPMTSEGKYFYFI
jgi:hypothetical protein